MIDYTCTMQFHWKPLEFIEMGMQQGGRRRQAVMMAYLDRYKKQQDKELEEMKEKMKEKKDGER